MLKKIAKTQSPIHELISHRWSPRAFDNSRDLSSEQIKSLLEAARWAPSCYGDQPWYYIVCHKTTNPDAFEKAFQCLVPFNQEWVKNAPLLLLSISQNHFHYNHEPNRWAQHDTGAASENICLQAVAMGLAAHQMGGFDALLAQEVFEIPKEYTCLAMIAVGYQAAADILPDEMKKSELSDRERHPLEQHFFNGKWGLGLA